MAIPSRQIGWGTESNLLWQILKQLNKLTSVLFGLKEAATPNYKVYTALLTQEGDSAPQAIVLENTIGELSWGYRNLGYYSLDSLGTPFVADKTFINNNIVGPAGADFVFNRMTNRDDTGFDVQKGYAFEDVGNNSIRLKTYSDAGVLANDVIGTNNKLCIEIRVYN